jgi:hypothetical protein
MNSFLSIVTKTAPELIAHGTTDESRSPTPAAPAW